SGPLKGDSEGPRWLQTEGFQGTARHGCARIIPVAADARRVDERGADGSRRHSERCRADQRGHGNRLSHQLERHRRAARGAPRRAHQRRAARALGPFGWHARRGRQPERPHRRGQDSYRDERSTGRRDFMTTLVSVKNVVKRYTRGKQKVEVLHSLNLDIEAGEFLALMGPSGSGKTTLLNLIGGLDRPDSGEVVVAGERIDKLSNRQLARWRARNVGFVFQFYNLMPMLTAERNVELPLLLTNLSRARRRQNVQAALQLVGLSDRASHKPS